MDKFLFFMCGFLILTCVECQSQNCTVSEHRSSNFDKTIQYYEIKCRHVPPSFIITKYYFAERPFPQHLIVEESTIPVLSNYSSLLNMRNIRTLQLKGLGIKHIMPGAFRNMNNLEELDLSENELTEIPDGAFVGLMNLKKLNLVGNNITKPLKSAMSDLPKLEFLDIAENPVEHRSLGDNTVQAPPNLQ